MRRSILVVTTLVSFAGAARADDAKRERDTSLSSYAFDLSGELTRGSGDPMLDPSAKSESGGLVHFRGEGPLIAELVEPDLSGTRVEDLWAFETGTGYPTGEGLGGLALDFRLEAGARVVYAASPSLEVTLRGGAYTGYDSTRYDAASGVGGGHAAAFVIGGVRVGDVFVEAGPESGVMVATSGAFTGVIANAWYRWRPTAQFFRTVGLHVEVQSGSRFDLTTIGLTFGLH